MSTTPEQKSQKWSAERLRQSYIEFFEAKGHTTVASAPLIPHDPTLLFTSAGMVQFKSHYSDPKAAPYPTAVSVQKCLRAGGKASDLENVGRTLRHHTFFEMLGNFSFGDYFKQEAIDYAWELVTDLWRFDRDRLWVSVFEEDRDAFDLWSGRIGFPRERIVHLGRKDNFWGPVGDTGVCGPSSEIYYDTGPERGCRRPECRPGCDCDRFIEFWNLVFPQFFFTDRGEFDPLPMPGIDTGMGLERVAFILQGVEDNFHTDLFLPIRARIERCLPESVDGARAVTAVNVAADHVRALCFTMAEGLAPSNEGRGYILRRLLRRSLTKMHSFGVQKPFLHLAVDAVVDVMGVRYPELHDRVDFMKRTIEAEEERFLSTLEQGLERLEAVMAACKRNHESRIAGRDIFVLYDTYGFPPELTGELAEEAGLGVDMDGFTAAMEEQKERARSGGFHHGAVSPEAHPFDELKKSAVTTFLGYEKLTCETWCTAFRVVNGDPSAADTPNDAQEPVLEIVTEETVFYPESGGQIGDTGFLRLAGMELEVTGAYRIDDRIVHRVRLAPEGDAADEMVGRFAELARNAPCALSVTTGVRRSTARNHTATHLLHAALRRILGDHVVQAGSLVEPDRLRFDFNHFQAMTADELGAVEDAVNDAIMADEPVHISTMPYRRAIEEGVTALFGEKYGDDVRVVSIGSISKELCGGTHVGRTGEIGMFLVRQETAISSGVRRIEAVTGTAALRHVKQLISQRQRIAELFRAAPGEVEQKARTLLDEVASLRRKIESQESRMVHDKMGDAIRAAEKIGGVRLVTFTIDTGDIAALREAGDTLRSQLSNGVGLLLLAASKKPILLVVVSDDLIESGTVNANVLVQRLRERLSLRGGGKPHMAQVGLESTGEFDSVQSIVKQYLDEQS